MSLANLHFQKHAMSKFVRERDHQPETMHIVGKVWFIETGMVEPPYLYLNPKYDLDNLHKDRFTMMHEIIASGHGAVVMDEIALCVLPVELAKSVDWRRVAGISYRRHDQGVGSPFRYVNDSKMRPPAQLFQMASYTNQLCDPVASEELRRIQCRQCDKIAMESYYHSKRGPK